MPTLSELAAQGIRYSQLEEAPAEQQQEESGNFARGFKKAMLQVPQTVGGAVALAGDLAGSEGVRDYGLSVYQNNSDKIQAITKDSDSLSNVLEGDASGADWLANTAGYVVGQAGQAIATGGVGGFIGSQLAKRGIAGVVARGAESAAARAVAGKVASRGAAVGAGTALLGTNFTQEAGSIYPEALHVAAEEGRELTGADKARVVGSAAAAAGVDTAMDALMIGRVLKGARKPGESMLRAGVREVPGAMAREGITEGIQTGIERYGAGQELNTADAIRDYVDSVGVGVVGGGMGGAASVLRAQKVPESGPLTRAANTSIEQQILQLTNDPQPLIGFPDGSVGTKAEAEVWLQQFPEGDEREGKRRELMGRDPATGKRVEPKAAPEPTHAQTPEDEAAHMADWTAQHDPVDLDYAQSILATPGAKGKGLMIAPHPDGGFTLVEANKLTIDTQARLADLQKPVKAEKPTEGAAPDPEGPSEDRAQEWQTNPYAGYKFAEAERARAFMLEKSADPEQFDVQPVGNQFAIRHKGVITAPSGNPFKTEFAAKRRLTEGGYAATHDLLPVDGGFILQPKAEVSHADDAVLAQDGAAVGGRGDQDADLPGSGEIGGTGLDAGPDREGGTAQPAADGTAQSGVLRAAGGADADAALDNDWLSFSPETGTLAIPRADMPQIKAEHRGAMVNFLNARGIAHQQEEIAADTLKPTQAEFSLSKVEKAKAREGGERSILVSSDNHVLDGHHQWLAAVEKGEPVKIIRLDAPIAQLVNDVKEFPSATTEETADVPESPQVPEEAPATPGEEAAPQPDAAPAKPRSKLDSARAKHQRQDDAVAQAAANIAARKAAKEQADPARDDGADIPLAFYKRVKVPAEVLNEETGATESVDVPADVALKSVREDIQNLQALLKCMKGGA